MLGASVLMGTFIIELKATIVTIVKLRAVMTWRATMHMLRLCRESGPAGGAKMFVVVLYVDVNWFV